MAPIGGRTLLWMHHLFCITSLSIQEIYRTSFLRGEQAVCFTWEIVNENRNLKLGLKLFLGLFCGSGEGGAVKSCFNKILITSIAIRGRKSCECDCRLFFSFDVNGKFKWSAIRLALLWGYYFTSSTPNWIVSSKLQDTRCVSRYIRPGKKCSSVPHTGTTVDVWYDAIR